MFRHEQLASLCGPGLAVATIAFLFPHHTNAQSEMPVNKDYFEAAAQDVFGDAFTGLHDAPYAEIKSEYSSDYRGIAQIPLKGLEHMAFQPTNETTLRDYELLYADFPSVVTQDLGMPDGLLVLSLPSRPGDVFLYRFSQTATAPAAYSGLLMANSVGQFQLRRVLGLSAMGIPTLEGTNARLIVTGTFGESDVGRLAVCQAVTDQDEAPMMVVLGVVAEGAADTEGPLRLGRGKAVLELYDDGRVRLKGSNVVLDSTGALQMIAAQIDLN